MILRRFCSGVGNACQFIREAVNRIHKSGLHPFHHGTPEPPVRFTPAQQTVAYARRSAAAYGNEPRAATTEESTPPESASRTLSPTWDA